MTSEAKDKKEKEKKGETVWGWPPGGPAPRHWAAPMQSREELACHPCFYPLFYCSTALQLEVAGLQSFRFTHIEARINSNNNNFSHQQKLHVQPSAAKVIHRQPSFQRENKWPPRLQVVTLKVTNSHPSSPIPTDNRLLVIRHEQALVMPL